MMDRLPGTRVSIVSRLRGPERIGSATGVTVIDSYNRPMTPLKPRFTIGRPYNAVSDIFIADPGAPNPRPTPPGRKAIQSHKSKYDCCPTCLEFM